MCADIQLTVFELTYGPFDKRKCAFYLRIAVNLLTLQSNGHL